MPAPHYLSTSMFLIELQYFGVTSGSISALVNHWNCWSPNTLLLTSAWRELANDRLGVVEVVVGDRVVADDPGVHVEAGGLHDDALSGLGKMLALGVVRHDVDKRRSIPGSSPP